MTEEYKVLYWSNNGSNLGCNRYPSWADAVAAVGFWYALDEEVSANIRCPDGTVWQNESDPESWGGEGAGWTQVDEEEVGDFQNYFEDCDYPRMQYHLEGHVDGSKKEAWPANTWEAVVEGMTVWCQLGVHHVCFVTLPSGTVMRLRDPDDELHPVPCIPKV